MLWSCHLGCPHRQLRSPAAACAATAAVMSSFLVSSLLSLSSLHSCTQDTLPYTYSLGKRGYAFRVRREVLELLCKWPCTALSWHS